MQCCIYVHSCHWQTALMITDWFLMIPCWSHEAIHPILSTYHVGSPIYINVRSAGDKYKVDLLTRCGVHLLLQSSKFKCLPRGWVPGQQLSNQYSQWRVKRVWVDGHLCSCKMSSSPALIHHVFTTHDGISVQSATRCRGKLDTDPEAEHI